MSHPYRRKPNNIIVIVEQSATQLSTHLTGFPLRYDVLYFETFGELFNMIFCIYFLDNLMDRFGKIILQKRRNMLLYHIYWYSTPNDLCHVSQLHMHFSKFLSIRSGLFLAYFAGCTICKLISISCVCCVQCQKHQGIKMLVDAVCLLNRKEKIMFFVFWF